MEVKQIAKRYGKKQILKDISFQTEKGKCIGIIGANGCGKSTLLRILAGAEKPDSGIVMVDGKTLTFGKGNLSGQVGYVPQENALMEELSVKDNMELFIALGKEKADKDYIEALCRQFSVSEFTKERVTKLSGGMKKRVSIVCALINRPRLLILDEPSAALDLVFKEELKESIKVFTKGGGTVILSSHDKGEIENCDELYVIQNGTIVPVEKSLSVEEMTARYMQKGN